MLTAAVIKVFAPFTQRRSKGRLMRTRLKSPAQPLLCFGSAVDGDLNTQEFSGRPAGEVFSLSCAFRDPELGRSKPDPDTNRVFPQANRQAASCISALAKGGC
ncbi:deoxyribodipyrimidine photo-lyase-like [Platysternon megacephalum]|uniref:Deoxyribodipyrimidine photo-lyase-like n=1 Tax=Platysternon megacephalum TaxID=55544 RepID=A0A4D9EHK5_9SAUR|nr:deoxyribodipyrimidine photo-lyase-like [Platysternon megacephalum]